jgi:hypothetical protein
MQDNIGPAPPSLHTPAPTVTLAAAQGLLGSPELITAPQDALIAAATLTPAPTVTLAAPLNGNVDKNAGPSTSNAPPQVSNFCYILFSTDFAWARQEYPPGVDGKVVQLQGENAPRERMHGQVYLLARCRHVISLNLLQGPLFQGLVQGAPQRDRWRLQPPV